MFSILYQNNVLIIGSSEPFIPVTESFLTRSGFIKRHERRMEMESSSPYDTIQSVSEMLQMYGIIELDAICRRILDETKAAQLNFRETVDKAASLKEKDGEYWKNQDMIVPKLDPDVSLKWYQKMPVAHSLTLENSANFSVPGSGKTWMGYSAFLKSKYEEKTVDKLLVVAPLAAFRPWETEYVAMTGPSSKREILRITGDQHSRGCLFKDAVPLYDKFLISHSMVSREQENLKRMMQDSRFMVIVDESHNIKRWDGKRATTLHDIAPLAKKRMILSGTPMPKSLEDLWSQFTFLYPDKSILGTWFRYQQECKSTDMMRDVSSRLSPYFVRVSKDMLNLPKPVFNPKNTDCRPTVVSMNPVQRRIYDGIALKIRQNVEQFRVDAVALEKFRKSAMIYLIEAATDPSLLTKDSTYPSEEIESDGLSILELLAQYPKLRSEQPGKIKMAVQLAKETLEGGGKVIIWCSFINTIKKMSEYMGNAGYESVRIWGEVPRDEEVNPEFNREGEIEKFKTDDRYNVLIANPSSLAESVSLHKVCHHAIYVDRTFNGAHYMQSLERIHRIGLDPEVRTRYDILQSDRSIDQTIHERLALKQSAMEEFLKSDKLGVYGPDDIGMSGFDESYAGDFDAVMKDMGRHVDDI